MNTNTKWGIWNISSVVDTYSCCTWVTELSDEMAFVEFICQASVQPSVLQNFYVYGPKFNNYLSLKEILLYIDITFTRGELMFYLLKVLRTLLLVQVCWLSKEKHTHWYTFDLLSVVLTKKVNGGVVIRGWHFEVNSIHLICDLGVLPCIYCMYWLTEKLKTIFDFLMLGSAFR